MTQPWIPGGGGGWITDPNDPRLEVLWPGSVDYVDDSLAFPLWVARIQCETFAPGMPVNVDTNEEWIAASQAGVIPENYVAAQVLQCRDLVRAGVVGDQGSTGGYEDVVTTFPMTWHVKNLLRPRRGKPYFGGARRLVG